MPGCGRAGPAGGGSPGTAPPRYLPGHLRGDSPHPSGPPAEPLLYLSAFLCDAHLPCSGLTRRPGARLLLFRGLTRFVRPSPSVNCSNEEVREGSARGSSLHVLQHNKDHLIPYWHLMPNKREMLECHNYLPVRWM